MWKGHKVSVVLPTFNEKDSIRNAIEDFFADGYVDEVVVVNNNAAPGTSEEVAKTRAREVFESRQGYGWAIRRGLDEASGDYIILSEPDGTFVARDVLKLLAYSDDFDVVLGTRTSRELIWEGANMGFMLKCGNILVAKMAEFLFNSTILTDMGCTMRLLKRQVVERIKPFFRVGGSHFGVEMLLILIKQRIRFMEIPVNYRERVGQSSVTGYESKAIWLGMKMIGLVLRARFMSLYSRPTASSSSGRGLLGESRLRGWTRGVASHTFRSSGDSGGSGRHRSSGAMHRGDAVPAGVDRSRSPCAGARSSARG